MNANPPNVPVELLLVEDNPGDVRLTEEALKEANLRVCLRVAANGAQAMDLLERAGARPDLILTDLHMPVMNGLELVSRVRSCHPAIPVILMTAYGTEEIAVQALRKGAASYVPKRNLVRELGETLRSVLAAARAERCHERLLECLTQTDMHFVLDNDPSLIPPLIGHIQQDVTRLKLCDATGVIRFGVALREALDNAFYHGNLALRSELREKNLIAYYDLAERRRRQLPYCQRRVYVTAKASPAEVVCIIRDEGAGFDPSRLPDPTAPANLECVAGRGLLLIRTFMDEVYHNERGNQITLMKRREPAPPAAEQTACPAANHHEPAGAPCAS